MSTADGCMKTALCVSSDCRPVRKSQQIS